MTRWWRKRHTLIAMLEEGTVDIICGKVRSNEPPLMSPMTRRSCVVYDLRHEPAPLLRTLVSQNFWVEDSTGRALVRMPIGEARLRMDPVVPDAREGILCEGDLVMVRGRVSFHVVPDPWLREAYRIAQAIPVLYGEGNVLLEIATKG